MTATLPLPSLARLFSPSMAVKLVLNEVTEIVEGLGPDEVVVVDEELLLPQAAINRPPAMMNATTAALSV